MLCMCELLQTKFPMIINMPLTQCRCNSARLKYKEKYYKYFLQDFLLQTFLKNNFWYVQRPLQFLLTSRSKTKVPDNVVSS